MPHFVNPQFGSASEAVLDAAQDAVHVVLVALELEYGIHDMFQYLGAGYASFLIDMPDEDDRRMRFLWQSAGWRRNIPVPGDAPGDDSRVSVEIVCMESMMTMSGRMFLIWT